MTFDQWWISEFGRPPLPGEAELVKHCLSAFQGARSSLEFEEKRQQLEESNEDIILFDGYEDALIGICIRFGQNPIAIYDVDQCIDILMKDSPDYESADEHFQFNTLGTWAGENTPAFLKRFR